MQVSVNHRMKFLKILFTFIASLLLMACGGGGSCSGVGWSLGAAAQAVCQQNKTSATPTGIPGSLSGVAAGGAPIIGNVEITDALGAKRGATIEANGHYEVNVQGMTGPFIIKAGGRVGSTWVTYYSAGLNADIGGTINVTPFTDIIVSSLAATVSDKFGSGADPTKVNFENIELARVGLYKKLYPLLKRMGVEDGIDFLRSVFNADHTKIDALFDLLQIQNDQDANIVTIKDFMGTVLGSIDIAKPIDDVPIPVGLVDPSASVDIRQIVQVIENFTSLFATKLPSSQQIAASGLVDTSSDFLDGGQSFQQWADEISSSLQLIGWKIVSVDVKLNSDGLSAIATGAAQNAQGVTAEDLKGIRFVKKQGRWQYQGDGLIANVKFSAIESFYQKDNKLTSGIQFQVDPFAYNNGRSAPVRVVKASITGPGLATTLPLAQNIYDTWLGVSESLNMNWNEVIECTPLMTWPCLNIADIRNNSEYKLTLKDVSNNVLNGSGYKVNLGLAPLPTSSLTRAMFGTIDRVTINGQPPSAAAFVPNQSLLVNFTLPANLRAGSLQVQATSTNGSTYVRIQKPVLPGNTSALIGWTLPDNNVVVNSLLFRLAANDFSGRKFVTWYWMSVN